MPGSADVLNPCWCCGHECMFCEPGTASPPCCGSGEIPYVHWCALCKISGCDWCCGCPGCHGNGRGGWSPAGIQFNHDGTGTREKQ